MQISNRLIVITGASSGIGAALAKAMARAGGRVALLARTQSALEKIAADIRRAEGTAYVFPVDLSDAVAAEQVAQRITAEIGVPDVLINNAGAGQWLFIEDTAPDEAVQMMALPYFAAFYLTRAFMPAMLQRRSGQIVMINSPAARSVWPGATGYTAARWALLGLTKALQADVYGTGLRVTSVIAGKVQNEYWANNPGAEARVPRITRIIPTLTSEQVADAVVDAIEHDRTEVIVPFMLRLLFELQPFFPNLLDWLVTRTGVKHIAP